MYSRLPLKILDPRDTLVHALRNASALGSMKTKSHKTDRKARVQTADRHMDLPSAGRSSEDAVPKSHGSARARRVRGKKPVRIGEALRQRGFDEHTIADHYVDVAHRLKGKSDQSGSVEKLLVDVLKECSKYLEPARPVERADERAAGRGAAVHVHLVHSVTRPARAAREDAASAAGLVIAVSSGAANASEAAAEFEAGATADIVADDDPMS
jgi:hypothetical protein